jgi:uncharacterized protein (TIGR00369 family)
MSQDLGEIEKRIRASFERQALMSLIGARLVSVGRGAVNIELDFRNDLTQQRGVLHAGVLTSILDSACGYAALTMMPEDADVVSVEFKVNLLRPADGDGFAAEGRVLKAGRTLTVVRGDAYASSAQGRTLVATMLATMMRIKLEDHS